MAREVSKLARRVGQYLRQENEHFSWSRVEHKQEHDYVSYVDKTSEQMLVEALLELLPEAGFLTEEGTAAYDGQPYCWVIDPLDGTTNFMHRYAPFAISVALCHQGSPVVGVVYEVKADECFCAWCGGGAWLNEQPISVSRHTPREALIGVELPYNAADYTATGLQLISRLYGRVSGLRMVGSAAVALAYVAAGRMEGWLERYIHPWDYMAGALLVEEAGGRTSTFSGDSHYAGGREIVATNGLLHDTLLQALVP